MLVGRSPIVFTPFSSKGQAPYASTISFSAANVSSQESGRGLRKGRTTTSLSDQGVARLSCLAVPCLVCTLLAQLVAVGAFLAVLITDGVRTSECGEAVDSIRFGVLK